MRRQKMSTDRQRSLDRGKGELRQGKRGALKKGLTKLGAGRPRAKILMAFVLMGGLRIPLLFADFCY